MIHIAPAHTDDIPKLSSFAAFTFDNTFPDMYQPDDLKTHLQATCSESFFARALSMREHTISIAKVSNRIVGYIYTSPLGLPVDNPVRPNHEVRRLYVHPDYKGQKLGTQLMMPTIEKADKECITLYLGVYSENCSAQRFYEQFGFQKVGEYNYPVGNHIDREFIMLRTSANDTSLY